MNKRKRKNLRVLERKQTGCKVSNLVTKDAKKIKQEDKETEALARREA
jgi:hypothetical protein